MLFFSFTNYRSRVWECGSRARSCQGETGQNKSTGHEHWEEICLKSRPRTTTMHTYGVPTEERDQGTFCRAHSRCVQQATQGWFALWAYKCLAPPDQYILLDILRSTRWRTDDSTRLKQALGRLEGFARYSDLVGAMHSIPTPSLFA